MTPSVADQRHGVVEDLTRCPCRPECWAVESSYTWNSNCDRGARRGQLLGNSVIERLNRQDAEIAKKDEKWRERTQFRGRWLRVAGGRASAKPPDSETYEHWWIHEGPDDPSHPEFAEEVPFCANEPNF